MSNKPDISRDQARPRTRALVEALRDVLANEEAWALVQKFLDEERAEGRTEGTFQSGDRIL
jgi:hypothetical protein